MSTVDKKEGYAKQLSLFLAELLRTRKITLVRAAEICQKVLENLNLIDTEEQFLRLVVELSSDFEELYHMGPLVERKIKCDHRHEIEQVVREFVIVYLATDFSLALNLLEEAIKGDCDVNKLSVKFPQFKEYMEKHKKWIR